MAIIKWNLFVQIEVSLLLYLLFVSGKYPAICFVCRKGVSQQADGRVPPHAQDHFENPQNVRPLW